ncbi:hypothetical protein [Fluviispira vulneris]|uniref:hypothetical protein n=1 Tax=Fluviispira vulneris TaxID=2763012 RepID=UPI0016474648|nr:hypothetical protein [Fluviispira vulneris]
MNKTDFNAEYVRELRASQIQKEKEESDIEYDKLINILKELILKNSIENKEYIIITNDDYPVFNNLIKTKNYSEYLVNYFNALGFKTEYTETRERCFNGKTTAQFKIEW